MNDDAVGSEQLIRQAIGGNRDAMSRVTCRGAGVRGPGAAGAGRPGWRGPRRRRRCWTGQRRPHRTREDRQLVAIARAHLAGDRELVDALARDHLVDFPGSYLVAWVASGAQVAGT